jgi:hypothetical protein
LKVRVSERERVKFERRLVERVLPPTLKRRKGPPATIKLGVSEKHFQEHVMTLARLYGWHGWHNSFSHGAVTGVHTLGRGDDHYDSNGMPDWIFWKEGRGHIFRELKAPGRYPTPDQRRCHVSLRAAGCDVDVWRPGDEAKIIATFSGVT